MNWDSYVEPLFNEFGFLEVVSVWLFLSGMGLLIVSHLIAERRYALSFVLSVFLSVAPCGSLWILKLTMETLPFLPRRVFGVEVIDISGIGMLGMVLFSFLITASEELTGELER